MPSVSRSQANLFRAAEHGADFPMAKKLRKSMTKNQMHDFAVTPNKGLPEHVGVTGIHSDAIHENTKTFKNSGLSEHEATKKAIRTARHKNLGGFLHKRKDGKPHGSD